MKTNKLILLTLCSTVSLIASQFVMADNSVFAPADSGNASAQMTANLKCASSDNIMNCFHGDANQTTPTNDSQAANNDNLQIANNNTANNGDLQQFQQSNPDSTTADVNYRNYGYGTQISGGVNKSSAPTSVNSSQFTGSSPFSLGYRYDQNYKSMLYGAYGYMFNPYNGVAVKGDFGKMEHRANITFGHAFSAHQQIKLTYEFLAQKMPFDFITGKVNEWMHQSAFGGSYRYLFDNPWIQSASINAAYVKAASKSLPSLQYTGSDNLLYKDIRHIAGGTERALDAAITLTPMHNILLTVGGGYSTLKYNTLKLPTSTTLQDVDQNKNVKTIDYNAKITDILSTKYKASISGAHSATGDVYGASLSHIFGHHFAATVSGQMSKGKGNLPSDHNMMLSVSYPAPNAYSTAAKQTMASLKSWIQTPVVYESQVLAVKDEYIQKVNTPVSSSKIPDQNVAPSDPASALFNASGNTKREIKAIHFAQYFHENPSQWDAVHYNVSVMPNNGYGPSNNNGGNCSGSGLPALGLTCVTGAPYGATLKSSQDVPLNAGKHKQYTLTVTADFMRGGKAIQHQTETFHVNIVKSDKNKPSFKVGFTLPTAYTSNTQKLGGIARQFKLNMKNDITNPTGNGALTISATGLPKGLSLNKETISGTLASTVKAGTYPIKFTLSNVGGGTNTPTLDLTVATVSNFAWINQAQINIQKIFKTHPFTLDKAYNADGAINLAHYIAAPSINGEKDDISVTVAKASSLEFSPSKPWLTFTKNTLKLAGTPALVMNAIYPKAYTLVLTATDLTTHKVLKPLTIHDVTIYPKEKTAFAWNSNAVVNIQGLFKNNPFTLNKKYNTDGKLNIAKFITIPKSQGKLDTIQVTVAKTSASEFNPAAPWLTFTNTSLKPIGTPALVLNGKYPGSYTLELTATDLTTKTTLSPLVIHDVAINLGSKQTLQINAQLLHKVLQNKFFLGSVYHFSPNSTSLPLADYVKAGPGVHGPYKFTVTAQAPSCSWITTNTAGTALIIKNTDSDGKYIGAKGVPIYEEGTTYPDHKCSFKLEVTADGVSSVAKEIVGPAVRQPNNNTLNWTNTIQLNPALVGTRYHNPFKADPKSMASFALKTIVKSQTADDVLTYTITQGGNDFQNTDGILTSRGNVPDFKALKTKINLELTVTSKVTGYSKTSKTSSATVVVNPTMTPKWKAPATVINYDNIANATSVKFTIPTGANSTIIKNKDISWPNGEVNGDVIELNTKGAKNGYTITNNKLTGTLPGNVLDFTVPEVCVSSQASGNAPADCNQKLNFYVKPAWTGSNLKYTIGQTAVLTPRDLIRQLGSGSTTGLVSFKLHAGAANSCGLNITSAGILGGFKAADAGDTCKVTVDAVNLKHTATSSNRTLSIVITPPPIQWNDDSSHIVGKDVDGTLILNLVDSNKNNKTNGNFTFQIGHYVSNPMKLPLTFSIKKAIPGMTISGDTVTISKNITAVKDLQFIVTTTVGQGSDKKTYSLATAPESPIVELSYGSVAPSKGTSFGNNPAHTIARILTHLKPNTMYTLTQLSGTTPDIIGGFLVTGAAYNYNDFSKLPREYIVAPFNKPSIESDSNGIITVMLTGRNTTPQSFTELTLRPPN